MALLRAKRKREREVGVAGVATLQHQERAARNVGSGSTDA